MSSKRNRQEAELKKREGKNKSRNDARMKKSGGKGKARRGRLTTKKKVLLGVYSVLLIVVLTAMVGVAFVGSKMGKLETKKLDVDKLSISDELEYDETGYLNVALFGLDTRANDESMGSRSDTIIIASLNRETKVVKMASVYRDTLMQLDDGEYYKANAAYSFGKEDEAVAMLNRNLDMNIEHYVTVDFSSLVDVIDAVGGIEIDIKEEELEGEMAGELFSINGYIMDIMDNTGIQSDFINTSGLQTLNGVQATAYARIRYTAGGDIQRAERQRLVMTKVGEKLQEANLLTLNKIIDSVFPKVKTNFTLTEILAYAKDVKKYQFGENIGFPINEDNVAYGDQGSCITSMSPLADVQELHKYFFGEDGYTPTSIVTSICNDLSYIYGGTTDTYSGSGYTDNSVYYGDGSYDSGTYDDGSYDSGTYDDGSYSDGTYDDESYSGGGYDTGTEY